MKTTFLTIGGIYCLVFGLFHLLFWKIFRWKEDLRHLTPVNRAIMQVLNLCLTYVFLFFAALCFLFQEQLLTAGLGQFVLGAIAVFWFLRAVEQIWFFGMKTAISIGFFFLFLVGSGLFLIPVLG